MNVVVSSALKISLSDGDNFRQFKVIVQKPKAEFDMLKGAFPGAIRFDDADTAWVAITAIKDWHGKADDATWHSSLNAMIAAALPHGWISKDNSAIRGHVVWNNA